jgi:hypothetical protein
LPRLTLPLRSTAALALALAFLFRARPLRAEPVEARSTEPQAPAAGAPYSLQGFDVLASAGWGASTATIGNLELAPYGASFGADAGYTLPLGLRLGAHFDYSLGHGVVHHRDPRIGRDFDFTADASSINGGFSMGWDVPLYALLLRYTIRLGFTSMSWDFGADPRRPLEFDDVSNPVLGLHVAPGMAVLWPYRWFEAGVGFDYLAQANSAIPSGFQGKVLVGVRP